MSRGVDLWIAISNSLCALYLLTVADAVAFADPWFFIAVGLIVLLVVGIVRQVRGSSWSSSWNVGIFAAIAMGALLYGLFAASLMNDPSYNEGSGWVFYLWGLPAIALGTINFFLFRHLISRLRTFRTSN